MTRRESSLKYWLRTKGDLISDVVVGGIVGFCFFLLFVWGAGLWR